MFPLNGMRSQLRERLCLFLIRKQQLISYMLGVLYMSCVDRNIGV